MRLLKEGVFISAYPLHDVWKCFNNLLNSKLSSIQFEFIFPIKELRSGFGQRLCDNY